MDSSPVMGSSQEINDIQEQIEIYTKKIEHEKINLRLCNERYNKQLEQLLKLQNRKMPQKAKKSKKRESVQKQPEYKKESYHENPQILYDELQKKALQHEKVR